MLDPHCSRTQFNRGIHETMEADAAAPSSNSRTPYCGAHKTDRPVNENRRCSFSFSAQIGPRSL